MAEINALLDLASPALREALLMAFLDRLSRPVRRPAGERHRRCLQWPRERTGRTGGRAARGAADWAEALAPVDDTIVGDGPVPA